MSILTRAKKILKKDQNTVKAKKAPTAKAAEANPESQSNTQEASMAEFIKLSSVLTEKSLRAQEKNTVVFKVRPFASKHQISQAIFEQFGVRPKSIRTARFQSKVRRRGRAIGFTSPWKKAYVKVDDVTKLTTEE